VGLYSFYRAGKKVNPIFFICVESLGIVLSFLTFPPLFIILLLSIGLSELVFFVSYYFRAGLKPAIKNAIPGVLPLVFALCSVIPLFSYFKVIEITETISKFYGFNSEMYLRNLSIAFKYFRNFELLWLMVFLKFVLLLHIKTILGEKSPLLKVSFIYSLLFIISFFMIPRIPQYIYIRYLIFLQPVMSVIILMDLFVLVQFYSSKSKSLINLKMALVMVVSGLLFLNTLFGNTSHLKGHVYEMFHQYKGPLDYTIPFIRENYTRTDTLLIAANYEEFSYIYYLHCKTIVGYVGNNLEADSKQNPDIITYRKYWGNHLDIFKNFVRRVPFEVISFPVFDNMVNNIPELNYYVYLNHRFQTVLPEKPEDAVTLYLRK
jgi:hypothetical protein